MLFIVGINFGLRVSDLLTLRFSHLITDSFTYRPEFKLLEKKTANTRSRKKNRCISINKAVREAINLYLVNTPDVKLSDYMFRSISNNGYSQNKPIHRNSVERLLKGIAEDLELPYHMSTHTLRKTFGYHQMAMANHDHRKLLLLQKMFGHSTSSQTLDYIGLTNEEMAEAYMEMNLGLREKSRVDSVLMEEQQGITA